MHPLLFLLTLRATQAQADYDYFQQGRDWTGICSTGSSQSPIDIEESPIDPGELVPVTTSNSTYLPVSLNYSPSTNFTTQQTDVTYQVSGLRGSLQAVIEGGSEYSEFNIINLHFHAPSEHQFDGLQYPLEMHVPNSSADNTTGTAALAVWFIASFQRSVLLDAVIYGNTTLDLNAELGSQLTDYFLYRGSMEMPPCSEKTYWYVLRNPLPAAVDQIEFFRGLWQDNPNFAGGNGNTRQPQELYGRTIYHFTSSDAQLTSFLSTN